MEIADVNKTFQEVIMEVVVKDIYCYYRDSGEVVGEVTLVSYLIPTYDIDDDAMIPYVVKRVVD